ncbi:HGxxPAAW family protein [Brevibacterium litoralis]|uniref:HGxxPAAW family protein n=1 Tax=Brevibacterium litoralis TaxID=3138935 RepID=UPI0032F0324C
MSEITVRSVAPDLDRASIDYEAIQDPGHGHSPAAWIAVTIILIASTVATVFNLMGDNMLMLIVGAAGWIGGPVLGLILSKVPGMGAKGHH